MERLVDDRWMTIVPSCLTTNNVCVAHSHTRIRPHLLKERVRGFLPPKSVADHIAHFTQEIRTR
jgi:hypothetical protein